MDHKEKAALWKVAYFDQETKEKIKQRDGYRCILCPSHQLLDCHHVYYATESERGPMKNHYSKGVTLCRVCHLEVHWCRMGTWKRFRCIEYLEKIDNT